MAIATCDISGTITDVGGDPVENVTIRAYPTSSFIHGTDWVPARQVETTTDSNGDWTLTVIQTTSVERTITLEIEFPDGGEGTKLQRYTITVPDAATANFEDLITTP